jgi:hypothetical protein
MFNHLIYLNILIHAFVAPKCCWLDLNCLNPEPPLKRPNRPPRRRQATRAERPVAVGLAAAARFLPPVPPRRRPSSRWQGARGSIL